uniref:Fringe-like glycosyltransferase domain-containing protein n=1 Tax=viral metagenome TaxID=1070528 RepID=A0A6C0I1I7_9ZZZZ
MEKNSKYKVIINVFACPTIERYRNEILKINETWRPTAEAMGVKVLFFFGEEGTDLIDDNYIYLPNVQNDYDSASYKQYLGLKHIYENYNAEFIFSCGTDTFINIKHLLSYLDRLEYGKKLYIGGHDNTRQIGDKSVYFHCGGAGVIITNKILEELYPQLDTIQNQWRVICEQYELYNLIAACDVSISYFLINIGVEVVTNTNFHSCNYLGYRYDGVACCKDIININTLISCHQMRLNDFDNFQKIIDTNSYAINNKYIKLCNTSSDINEHLPTLCQLATECNSILELGVRGVVSSWAFASGLLLASDTVSDTARKPLLFLNDLEVCNISELLDNTKDLNIEIKYQWINCLDLDFTNTFDMVFIDTWHIYGQLKRELEKFSKIANKYIVMHDTTVDEYEGETIRGGLDAQKQSEESGFPIEEILQGLGKAIDEFLINNPNWILKKKYTNNNGLTILEKLIDGVK